MTEHMSRGMTSEKILELANNPLFPSFYFGTEALKEWEREHRNMYTGECFKYSGPYVVIHKSTDPEHRPDFRVLSVWNPGHVVPHSWDVPVQ